MWEMNLQTTQRHPLLTFAGGGSRSRQSRLRRFCRWQIEHHQPWYLPDLAAWRDRLLQLEGLNPTTVRAYLSTVRSAYDQLLRSNQVRQWLYTHLAADMAPERKWVLVAEFTTQLQNAIDPANAPVQVITVQDEEDTAHVWLTPNQVAALVQAPGLDTWKGLRDTALIALLLCTGIRAAEAAALEVDDLRATLGGALALKVRAGKGFKQRLIPYGAQEWGLALVEAWLARVGLTEGPVFVGLRKGDHFFLDAAGQPRSLSVRSIEVALASYAIPVNGQFQTVSPHDLRRTYARQLYLVGTDLVAIQQNLGHDRQETTLAYIGTLDAEQRTPGDAYGTAWLQPLWEQLAQQESASQPSAKIGLDPSDGLIEELKDHPPSLVQHNKTIGGYVFKIWIDGLDPLIWRRFKVPAGLSFETLHDIVQIVLGWENYHLYRFEAAEDQFTPHPMGLGDHYPELTIDAHLQNPGSQLYYVYDFGDMWGHLLELEKHLVRPVKTPSCMAGHRACPPEDCGGPWLYDEFLRSRRKRSGRVSQKWQHRIGNYWDADAFDRAQVNQALAEYWSDIVDLPATDPSTSSAE